MGKQKTKKSRNKKTTTTGETTVSDDFAESCDEVRGKDRTVLCQDTDVAEGNPAAANALGLLPVRRMSETSIDLKLPPDPPEQESEDEPHHEMLPWLSSSGRGPSVKSSDEFDLDASFVTSNFDLATVASDTDDDSHNRETSRGDEFTAEDEEGKLTETLSKQGIRLIIEIEEDDESTGAMSDLSLSNQSYILDLALQKQAREQNLKEESLEEAFVLYSDAKKKGHRGEGFFLMLLAEVQAKKRASKAEFYKTQDERLDKALDDELERQSRMASISFGSLPTGTKRTSERVDDVIKARTRTRKTMSEIGKVASTREAIIQAASELVIEMSDDGDYEWGNDDGSDDFETKSNDRDDGSKNDVTGTKKAKKKTNQDKKEKEKRKTKGGKSKKKKIKSSTKPESTPSVDELPSLDTDKKPKKSNGKKLKKSVKGDNVDRKPDNENDEGQDSTVSPRLKNGKETSEKLARKKKTKKNTTPKNDGLSGTDSISTSEGNELMEASVDGQPPSTDPSADFPTKEKQKPEQKPAAKPIVSVDEVVPLANPQKKPNWTKSMGKQVLPRKKLAGLLSTVFGHKGHPTPGDDSPKKVALFGRSKAKCDDTDPAKR